MSALSAKADEGVCCPLSAVTVTDKNGKVIGTYQYIPQSESEARKLFPPEDVNVDTQDGN